MRSGSMAAGSRTRRTGLHRTGRQCGRGRGRQPMGGRAGPAGSSTLGGGGPPARGTARWCLHWGCVGHADLIPRTRSGATSRSDSQRRVSATQLHRTTSRSRSVLSGTVGPAGGNGVHPPRGAPALSRHDEPCFGSRKGVQGDATTVHCDRSIDPGRCAHRLQFERDYWPGLTDGQLGRYGGDASIRYGHTDAFAYDRFLTERRGGEPRESGDTLASRDAGE